MKKTLNILIIISIIVFSVFLFVNFWFSIKFPVKFESEIALASKTTGIDKNIILSVSKTESGFKKNAVSSAGAVGIMQVLPTTAKFVCEKNNLEFAEGDLLIPEKNILIGSLYLKYLFNKFEVFDVVMAAYNAGEGNVFAWLNNKKYSDDGKTLKSIPFPETRDYVKKVNKNVKIYKIVWK